MSTKSRKQQLEALLAEDPDDAFVRYGLAMEYVSAGEDTQAVLCFQELITRNPDYVPGYQQLGQALCRLGRGTEARAAWQEGIRRAQQQGNLHAAREMQGMLEMVE